MTKLTHLDDRGAARMVDVSAKDSTEREAIAEATVILGTEAYTAMMSGTAPKGDVLAAARIAGIMAAKKTSELIPLCHPLALSKANVDFEPQDNAIRIIATVKTTGQTGVEMEALTAASIAALTIYDMIKAVDKAAVIESVRLIAKSGGKSGNFHAPQSAKREPYKPRDAAPRAKPATLMGEVTSPKTRADSASQREAFRSFMTSHGLRATEWAKSAGVPTGQILSFLTGKSRAIPGDVAEKLARAARARVEDMFR